MASLPPLRFLDLHERHPGITDGIGAGYAEAARVCLDRHHEPPAEFAVSHSSEITAAAEWEKATSRMIAAWANETDTTEAGAYAIALAAVELSAGMVAISRAETGTGADYYVAPSGSSLEDLEGCYRLEVSGTDRGDKAIIAERLQIKVKQALKGNSNLPALAAVVGFREGRVLIAPAEEQ